MKLYGFTVALALSACVSTGPGSYRQAAPSMVPVGPPPVMTPGYAPGTPAQPVYTPLGAGAGPGERAPMPGARALPASPNKRIVPPEPDGAPGLWAADGDPVLSASVRPDIGNVTLPYPDDAREIEDLRATLTCAGSMTRALKEARQHVRYFNQPEPIQRCLAARMYKACADHLLELIRVLYATGNGSAEEVRRHQSTAWKAQAFVAEQCRGMTLGPSQNEVLNATVTQWKTVIRNSPPPPK